MSVPQQPSLIPGSLHIYELMTFIPHNAEDPFVYNFVLRLWKRFQCNVMTVITLGDIVNVASLREGLIFSQRFDPTATLPELLMAHIWKGVVAMNRDCQTTRNTMCEFITDVANRCCNPIPRQMVKDLNRVHDRVQKGDYYPLEDMTRKLMSLLPLDDKLAFRSIESARQIKFIKRSFPPIWPKTAA